MPKVIDYNCNACGTSYEFMHHPVDEPAQCPKCGSPDASRAPSTPLVLQTIIPIYPGSKKHKAGYVHSHGDRPAEKIQVSVPRSMKGTDQ